MHTINVFLVPRSISVSYLKVARPEPKFGDWNLPRHTIRASLSIPPKHQSPNLIISLSIGTEISFTRYEIDELASARCLCVSETAKTQRGSGTAHPTPLSKQGWHVTHTYMRTSQTGCTCSRSNSRWSRLGIGPYGSMPERPTAWLPDLGWGCEGCRAVALRLGGGGKSGSPEAACPPEGRSVSQRDWHEPASITSRSMFSALLFRYCWTTMHER